MGIEYVVRVAGESDAVPDDAEYERLLSTLSAMDPGDALGLPHVTVRREPRGLYICNHLSSRDVPERILGAAVRYLLRGAVQVIVEEL
jgi:hypothetical protein